MAMSSAPIGKSIAHASRIGLGTWAIGGTEWGGTDRGQAEDAIRAAIDRGITLIDTAPIYGYGISEEIVGAAIGSCRDEVVLATKCGLVWDEAAGEPFFDSEHGLVHRCLKPASIRRQVELSLRRLNTDRIDLYQTHFPDRTTPIAETMGALLDLQAAGKIREIGVSNVSRLQLDEYRRVGPVASVQEQYNMVDRRQETDLLPDCVETGTGFLAYSPLAMGLLSGRITATRHYEAGDVRAQSPRFSAVVVESVNGFLAQLAPIAAGHGCTMAQLVVGWTMSRRGVSHVLSGIRSASQAEENLAAAQIVLSAEDLVHIDQVLEATQLTVPALYA